MIYRMKHRCNQPWFTVNFKQCYILLPKLSKLFLNHDTHISVVPLNLLSDHGLLTSLDYNLIISVSSGYLLYPVTLSTYPVIHGKIISIHCWLFPFNIPWRPSFLNSPLRWGDASLSWRDHMQPRLKETLFQQTPVEHLHARNMAVFCLEIGWLKHFVFLSLVDGDLDQR